MKKDKLLRTIIILLILLVLGPELVLATEMISFLDMMGISLFIMTFRIGLIRCIPGVHLIQKLFPLFNKLAGSLFFIPTIKQINTQPGIIYHAMPVWPVLYLCVLYVTYATWITITNLHF